MVKQKQKQKQKQTTMVSHREESSDRQYAVPVRPYAVQVRRTVRPYPLAQITSVPYVHVRPYVRTTYGRTVRPSVRDGAGHGRARQPHFRPGWPSLWGLMGPMMGPMCPHRGTLPNVARPGYTPTWVQPI